MVLTDTLYLPGTLRLLESWLHCNDALPIIALSRDPLALANSKLAQLSQQRHLIDPTRYADIRPYKKSKSQRHGETFYKFEAFRDFGYERNIFLDSDLLCLRETPALLQPADHALLAVADTGFRKTRGYKGHAREINTGVLSIHRSLLGESTVAQLKQIAQDNPGRSGYNSGDQGIVNKWIHANDIDLSILPSEYNLIKKDYRDTQGIDTCRLLHFCDRKPWFRRHEEPTELEALWLES